MTRAKALVAAQMEGGRGGVGGEEAGAGDGPVLMGRVVVQTIRGGLSETDEKRWWLKPLFGRAKLKKKVSHFFSQCNRHKMRGCEVFGTECVLCFIKTHHSSREYPTHRKNG